MKKFLSIVLSILMVVTMLPMSVLPAFAATEAAEVTDDAFIIYSSGVTQYVKHNNYLYKVAYTNLKIESVDIDISSYEDLRIYGTTNRYCALLLAYQGSNAKSSNLPTSPGKSVSFYTADTYASNEKKPVVTVTCMAVSEPVWSWNDVSSATAVFTSTDGGATMTVDAAIEISEKTAENCLETDTTAYTATATANGKEYTNVKTIYGEQGSHNIEYIKSGDYMIGSCTNGCGMTCTHNWTDKNDYLCDNCGFECHHESYTDGFCTVCGFECAHENITDGKCDDCGEDGIVVTITMTDSYGDGWRGNAIVVKQLVDGAYTEVATATFEDGASETFTALLRQDGIYAFSWVYGEHPEDCGFTLAVDGETVYECADVGTLADSEIFYIICKHTSYTDGKCDVCDYECPHENQTGSVCEICGEHICSYNNGFCAECDTYQPATLVTNENYESFYLKADYVGYYAISNAGQLFWYANYINTVDRTANAVLTSDIDLENRPWTPIGSTGENSNNFRGIFDGQNYIIRGLYVEGDRAGLGFFGEVRTGTVKNFTIYGEVVVNTEVDYVGGVIGSICGVNGENDLERNGAIIQNIKSFVNLTVKAHGVGKIGGFVGYANHQSLIEQCSWYGTFDAGEYRVDNGAGGFIGRIQENSSEVTIRNCGAYGTIKTNYAGDYNDTATIYMGGFLSFSNTNAKTTIENCLFAGRFKRGENLTDEAFLGAFGTLRSVNAIKNCYYLGDDGLEAVHSDSNLKPGSDNVEITKATGEELKKGTVAKKLGEYWEQGVHYPTLKDHAAHWGSETYGYTDNGDGTHDMVCTGCGHVEVYNEAHSGGTATCTEQAKCERCGASYGELNPDNHASDTYTYTDNGDGTHKVTYSCCGAIVAEGPHTLDITTGKCSACGADMTAIATVTDSTNTYYAADAATLNQAVTAILETGSRTFTVELPADTEAEMITAIRRAICDTEGVADGSINLTLKGVTSIPGTTNWDGVAFGPGDIYDEAGEIVDQELITQLASVNLPDATEIGAQAFYFCENLVAVSAPKAQTIGAQALGYTALTSVEFPELTTIPTDMFSGTWTLSSAKFPKVTTIEQNGLLIGAKFNPENNPTPFPLELTAEGDITFIGSNHFNTASQNYSGKVDLVLCCDKKDAVTFHDDSTATWQVRDDLSYTFKSITFKHSYTDGVCDNCGYECPHENVTGATCRTPVKCDVCGYSVFDWTNHEYENNNGFCTECDAYEPAELNENGYYEIGNAGQLYWFADKAKNDRTNYGSANAILTQNIVVNENVLTADGKLNGFGSDFRAWIPPYAYKGTFDGAGKTVSGLYFKDTEERDVGFIGYLYGGTVKNLTVKDSYFNAYSAVGGIVGSVIEGTVTDCFSSATVIAGSLGYAGGIAGENGAGLVERCANSGFVTSGYEAGGIVGYNHNYYDDPDPAIIRHCYNIGSVSGYTVGGIVGYAVQKMGSSVEIDSCWAACELNGTNSVGGLIGHASGSTIRCCSYDKTVFTGNPVGKKTSCNILDSGFKSTEEFASGAAAYLLNGKSSGGFWRQTIGTDAYPGFSGDKVYYGYISCADNAKKVYTNDATATEVKPTHNWSNNDGICANGCGYECTHVSYTGGVCDNCNYECPHEWGEGVLTRPTFESKGYYTYTCTLCGNSYTEPVERADTTALNDASMKVTEYIDNDTLTQEAKDEIYKSYRDIVRDNGSIFDEFGFVRGDLVEEDQPAINAVTEELQKIIDEAEEKIASGEYVKADYTDIDEAIDDIEEKLASENVTDEGKAELEEIKKQLEEMKADENTSEADLAELEKALEDYEEELDKGIEDGTLVKVDGIAILIEYNNECAESLIEKYGEEKYNNLMNSTTDEVVAEATAIEKEAMALTGTVAENAEKIAELKERLKALFDAADLCLAGTHSFMNYTETSSAKCEVNAKETGTCWFCGETDEREVEGTALSHSFTKYEVTEEAKCGVAGKEVAYCDNGCQTTDERETPALEHVFLDYVSNGDATCTADGTKTASCIHGCGETDTVADEGSMIDHSDEDGDKLCDDCGEEVYDRCDICGGKAHGDDKIQLVFCMIITIIRFVTAILKSIN